MLECLILGDSIAVGVGAKRPECITYAKGGINTYQWNNKFITKDLSAPVVIISLGSNDHKYVKTRRELETMRALVKADRVYWVLPHGNLKASEVPIETIQYYIQEIAKVHGDIVLPIKYPSSDKIHPSDRGYRELANSTKQ
jgi:lysophospholipase L1-like esterase